MQPYFLPYIGYFQLINAVDEFIVYDNIQFSKKGWFHRNRMLQNSKDEYFSLTLKKDSDYLDVKDRSLSDGWSTDRDKILRKINENYKKAPFFREVYPLIEEIFLYSESNLFAYIYHSLQKLCRYLGINTPLTVSSTIDIDHTLKSQAKVLELTKAVGGDFYLNPIGGLELYNTQDFEKEGVTLRFHKARPVTYKQLGGDFVPWLSILDVLAFNPKEQVMEWLNEFDIVVKG